METLRIDGYLFATWSSLSEECKREAKQFFVHQAEYLPMAAYLYRVHSDGKVYVRAGRYISDGMKETLRNEWTVRQIQES